MCVFSVYLQLYLLSVLNVPSGFSKRIFKCGPKFTLKLWVSVAVLVAMIPAGISFDTMYQLSKMDVP